MNGALGVVQCGGLKRTKLEKQIGSKLHTALNATADRTQVGNEKCTDILSVPSSCMDHSGHFHVTVGLTGQGSREEAERPIRRL